MPHRTRVLMLARKDTDGMAETIRTAGDLALGAGATATPLWIFWLDPLNKLFVLLASIGGAMLVLSRLYIVWADYFLRRRRRRLEMKTREELKRKL